MTNFPVWQEVRSLGLSGNILITGGSGTLGHAIVRTAEREGWPCTFTIYSRSELRQAQMRTKHPHLRSVLGDVCDYDRLAAAVAGHDLVIHAAAMKRIPDCEAQPTECYATNVQGSANVVRACLTHNVRRCVGISTDKACAAITTYGASKRLMESLFQAALGQGPTTFTLARYGNVVASAGSVIPLWRQQHAEGQPLSVTSWAMTRFWMGLSDAVRAIVRACEMPDSTITVPKCRALSLAMMTTMVIPECETVETGLRSREKMHEDLVHPDEAATDGGDYYTLTPSPQGSGISYTSRSAPRMEKAAFLAMLQEAESYE